MRLLCLLERQVEGDIFFIFSVSLTEHFRAFRFHRNGQLGSQWHVRLRDRKFDLHPTPKPEQCQLRGLIGEPREVGLNAGGQFSGTWHCGMRRGLDWHESVVFLENLQQFAKVTIPGVRSQCVTLAIAKLPDLCVGKPSPAAAS